jgi:hypothetical protein
MSRRPDRVSRAIGRNRWRPCVLSVTVGGLYCCNGIASGAAAARKVRTLRKRNSDPSDESWRATAEPTERLRVDWLRASIDAGWAEVDEWYQPVVDDVVRAVFNRTELRDPIAALAAQRCLYGVTLDETLADVGAFVASAPPDLMHHVDRFEIARITADAWYRSSVDPQAIQPCRDPLTGLSSEGHLLVRAAELYQQALATGLEASSTHELVVLGWEHASESAAELGMRIRLAAHFQRCFDGGQTIAQIGDGAIVVITRRDLCPQEMLDQVEGALEDVMAGAVHTKATRWPFPRTIDDLSDLLSSLHGNNDSDGWASFR